MTKTDAYKQDTDFYVEYCAEVGDMATFGNNSEFCYGYGSMEQMSDLCKELYNKKHKDS